MAHNADKSPDTKPRTKATYVKLTDAKREQVENLAAELGCSISDVIRAALLPYLARHRAKAAK